MLLEKYLPRIEFDSYEDLKNNYTVNEPDDFNFGWDIVDGWAKEDVNKRALVWCDDHGGEKVLTFSDISRLSNKTVHFLKSLGIKKGDRVMLILRRRWEYWICATALHKLGAVLIPANLQLTKKDIVYRANSAEIKAVICVNDTYVLNQVDASLAEAASIKHRIIVAGDREGWLNFGESIAAFSEELARPTGEEATKATDTMLIYFTSGTTSMPKLVAHNFKYPLGQIVTAKYWQHVEENMLHMSVSDSGWAKFGWGKIYGQWICGATIFAYDMDKFTGAGLLAVLEKYKVTTFCAPPTMYRFMLQEDVSKYDLSSIHHCATAGEPLNPEVVKKWKEFTGHMIYEGFGQTETTVVLANFGWDAVKPGSTGKPSPIYNITLMDAEGREVEDGEEGYIVVNGIDEHMPVGLFTSYFGDAERTQRELGGKYYSLGD
ncbi:MAG: AMP-binding protein, partial [Oscillospiraceae bacterium]|nr:AMP-binding protein [Oscillospiraceae bacterium]